MPEWCHKELLKKISTASESGKRLTAAMIDEDEDENSEDKDDEN